jgi:RNA polymerase sigma-70 factor, ECF subfamily
MPDDRITEALGELTVELRMVLFYDDIQGYRLREISEIMDIPHGTVMSRLHRARKRMRLRLAEVVDGRWMTEAPDLLAQTGCRGV